MVSWSSNVDSDGIPVDQDGEQLEDTCWFDGLHGHVGCVDSVLVSLLSPNPTFQGDVSHGESKPHCGVDGVMVQSDAMSISGGGQSEVSVNGEEVDKGEKEQAEVGADVIGAAVEGADVVEDGVVECSSGMKTKRGVKLPLKRKANVVGEGQVAEEEDGENNDAGGDHLDASTEPMNEDLKESVV